MLYYEAQVRNMVCLRMELAVVPQAAHLPGCYSNGVRRLAPTDWTPAATPGKRVWGFDSEELRKWQRRKQHTRRTGE